MSELPSKSDIVFMVSEDKEINGTKMFSHPWKHEMFNYSSGQTIETPLKYEHTSLYLSLQNAFYFCILEGFSETHNSCYFQHTEQNSETQELQMFRVSSS